MFCHQTQTQKLFQALYKLFQYSKNEIKGATKILLRVIKSPKVTNYSISSIAEIIEYSERPVRGSATLMNMIVHIPDLDESTLLSIQQSLENTEQSIPNSENFMNSNRKIRSLVPIDEEDEPLDEEERDIKHKKSHLNKWLFFFSQCKSGQDIKV